MVKSRGQHAHHQAMRPHGLGLAEFACASGVGEELKAWPGLHLLCLLGPGTGTGLLFQKICSFQFLVDCPGVLGLDDSPKWNCCPAKAVSPGHWAPEAGPWHEAKSSELGDGPVSHEGAKWRAAAPVPVSSEVGIKVNPPHLRPIPTSLVSKAGSNSEKSWLLAPGQSSPDADRGKGHTPAPPSPPLPTTSKLQPFALMIGYSPLDESLKGEWGPQSCRGRRQRRQQNH